MSGGWIYCRRLIPPFGWAGNAGSHAQPSRPTCLLSSHSVAWLVIVAAIATMLRLWTFNGLYGHDDWPYLFYVRSFLNGDTHELLRSPHGLRWGVWLPMAMLFKLLGVHYWLAFAPGFVLGLVCIPMAYLIAQILTGDTGAARWVSVAMALNPIDWFVSTTIRGDIEMSFYGGAIVLGLVALERRSVARAVPTNSLALAVGIIWGLAALTKESALLFGWGFLGVAIWRGAQDRRVPWEYGLILFGFLLVVAADSWFLYHATGDLGQRFHSSIAVYDQKRLEGDYQNDLSLSPAYLPSLFLNLSNPYTAAGRFVNGYPAYGWYFLVLLAAFPWAIWRIWRQDLSWPILLCFVVGVLLWFELGSMSLSTYLPYHKEPRYLAVLSVPIACLVGLTLHSWWHRLQFTGRILFTVAVGLITASVAQAVRSENELYCSPRDFLPQFIKWLDASPASRLWTTGTIQQDLDLHFAYRFSDQVHNQCGESGSGSIGDLCFLEQAKQGDLILVTPGSEPLLGTHFTPQRWKRLAEFRGPHSVAILYKIINSD
jgi:Dolichyl-phosphate-mannose-protein mannosyltransferase